jgi:hypothetical protein
VNLRLVEDVEENNLVAAMPEVMQTLHHRLGVDEHGAILLEGDHVDRAVGPGAGIEFGQVFHCAVRPQAADAGAALGLQGKQVAWFTGGRVAQAGQRLAFDAGRRRRASQAEQRGQQIYRAGRERDVLALTLAGPGD